MLLLNVPPENAFAQETTRCTKTTKLDGSGNIASKMPRPAFTVANVTVKKCLTVNKKTGEVKQVCKFENTGGTPVKFLFCNMIELKSGAGKVLQTQNCTIGFDAATMKWKCFPDPIPGGFMGKPAFHFGCKVVNLGASDGAPGGADEAESTNTGQSDDFMGKEAKDFVVSYADTFDLSITDMTGDDGFAAGTCTGCYGRNKSTNIEGGTGSVPGRAGATGYWIMSDVPITDPYVRWQEFDGTLHAVEYAALDDGLSVPSEFPIECPELGLTTPDAQPPQSYNQDMLIWDIFTMSDLDTEFTPVNIELFTDFVPPGVNLAVNPSFANVQGGSFTYGTLTIGHMPFVPEGTQVEWSIGFLDPKDPEKQLWEQDGRAIQDTVPPHVQAHSEFLNGSGDLVVSITAADATTSVVAANIYYSVDGGAIWGVEPLPPTESPINEPPVNTFAGVVPVNAAEGQTVLYFYNVQDGVLNHVWFGPGTITAPKCPWDTNRDGAVNVLDLIELLLCFGLPGVPPCDQEDINQDGVVNVLDLIELLLAFGTICPLNPPCDVVCDPLKTPEGEPLCADEYLDFVNGGCNSTPEVFGSVACGESICGEYGTFTVAAVANRDTDWYAITTALPTIFTFTVTGECETLLGVIDGNLPCAGAVFLVSATTPACTEASVVTACLSAGTYWFFVAPAAFTGCDCGSEYNASLTCATPCTP